MPSAQNFMVVFIHSGKTSESVWANPGDANPMMINTDIAITAPRATQIGKLS
ncbi:hypothetical protein AAA799B03_00672 [Marine Group I thaumarchaeote SCGC AAA799-B03]|uniref:Uncharacterized protein n=1 Tax=Marine Group I thaumarchaeote SCGC AAA799-B03 TaxID=1502289 RepID=A0A087S7L9_9ARCH|nr:hypothetical protein AAA799B03_00672 [Marine Group I thaumarchaeote SCGC AAA799-B03]